MSAELDKLAEKLADAKANRLRLDEAHRQARAAELQAEREYRSLHAEVHPPATIEVVVPEGMKHVGWYCEHEPISGAHGWIYTPHRSPTYKNKRGWEESTSVSRSVDSTVGPLTKAEAEKHCQYRRPVFVIASTDPTGHQGLS